MDNINWYILISKYVFAIIKIIQTGLHILTIYYAMAIREVEIGKNRNDITYVLILQYSSIFIFGHLLLGTLIKYIDEEARRKLFDHEKIVFASYCLLQGVTIILGMNRAAIIEEEEMDKAKQLSYASFTNSINSTSKLNIVLQDNMPLSPVFNYNEMSSDAPPVKIRIFSKYYLYKYLVLTSVFLIVTEVFILILLRYCQYLNGILLRLEAVYDSEGNDDENIPFHLSSFSQSEHEPDDLHDRPSTSTLQEEFSHQASATYCRSQDEISLSRYRPGSSFKQKRTVTFELNDGASTSQEQLEEETDHPFMSSSRTSSISNISSITVISENSSIEVISEGSTADVDTPSYHENDGTNKISLEKGKKWTMANFTF